MTKASIFRPDLCGTFSAVQNEADSDPYRFVKGDIGNGKAARVAL